MKLKRFHSELYYPEWAEDSILEFCYQISRTKLKYSYHAVNRLRNMKKSYKSAIKNLVNLLDLAEIAVVNNIFEFSSNSRNKVRKASFRFSLPDLDSDVILVISASSKIITLYLNGSKDLHETLNSELYEKETNESEFVVKVYPNVDLEMVLFIFLNTPTKRFTLWSSNILENDNFEGYKNELEAGINKSTIIINAIPGLKLIVDQSVIEFIDGEEEEIRKFVSMLVTEM